MPRLISRQAAKNAKSFRGIARQATKTAKSFRGISRQAAKTAKLQTEIYLIDERSLNLRKGNDI